MPAALPLLSDLPMKRGVYNQCSRKKRLTQRQANRAVQRLNDRQTKRVHAYFCDHCGQRHVGGVKEESESSSAQANH